MQLIKFCLYTFLYNVCKTILKIYKRFILFKYFIKSNLDQVKNILYKND